MSIRSKTSSASPSVASCGNRAYRQGSSKLSKKEESCAAVKMRDTICSKGWTNLLFENAPNDGVEEGIDALVVGPGGALPNVITIHECGGEERIDVWILGKKHPVHVDDQPAGNPGTLGLLTQDPPPPPLLLLLLCLEIVYFDPITVAA